MSRRAAFDPDALNVDDILAPPPPPPPPAAAAAAGASVGRATAVDVVHHAPDQSGPTSPAPVKKRDSVPAQPTPSSREAVTVVPARIPKELYEAIAIGLLGKSIERPSYAQLIVWTIQDHHQDVLDELTRQLAAEERKPRGRRLASDVVSIAVRFRGQEIDALTQLAEQAHGCTRTAAIIATFRVAVHHAGQ